MKKVSARSLVLTAGLISIAVVIDVIGSAIPILNLSMPFGGKFFGISIIPLVFVGILFGYKHGLIAGFIYAMYNFSADYIVYLDALRVTLESWTGETWGFDKILLLILLDYVIPFSVIGLSGVFYEKYKTFKNVILGFGLVITLRLLSATLSGVILWSSSIAYAVSEVESGNADPNIATNIFEIFNGNVFGYSLGYNAIYLITTFLISVVIMYPIYHRVIKRLSFDLSL
ncbi:MAG: energy-coupled thiamine transporter ThiT [Acholeplasmataceae bacterium]|jgi:thiamine transporter